MLISGLWRLRAAWVLRDGMKRWPPVSRWTLRSGPARSRWGNNHEGGRAHVSGVTATPASNPMATALARKNSQRSKEDAVITGNEQAARGDPAEDRCRARQTGCVCRETQKHDDQPKHHGEAHQDVGVFRQLKIGDMVEQTSHHAKHPPRKQSAVKKTRACRHARCRVDRPQRFKGPSG